MTVVSGWMNIMEHVHTRIEIKTHHLGNISSSAFTYRRFNFRDETVMELIRWHNVRLATMVGSINASKTIKQIKLDEVREGERLGLIMPFRAKWLECLDLKYSSIREWSRGEMNLFSKFLSERGLSATNLIEDRLIYWDGTIKDSEAHLELLKELTAVFEEVC